MKQKTPSPILGFLPLAVLWEDAASGPLFQSEPSARWYLRIQREQLVQAGALAIHAGRLLVDLEKFKVVAREVALQAAARRLLQ